MSRNFYLKLNIIQVAVFRSCFHRFIRLHTGKLDDLFKNGQLEPNLPAIYSKVEAVKLTVTGFD